MVNFRVVETIAGIIQGARLYALQSFRSAELLHPEFFQGIWPGYSREEMMALKSAAEPWVKRCIVR